jgi:thiamine-phosphate diphosphorylase
MPGRIMVITDRHQLGPPGGPGTAGLVDQLAAFAAAVGQAGADLLQLRERDVPDRVLLHCARAMVEAAAPYPVRVLVNDRAHLVVPAGLAGVHLPGSGMPAARVAGLLGRGHLIGRSVHAGDGLLPGQMEGVHYLLFGTVFPSGSKPAGHPVAGVEALATAVRRAGRPVFAVGGITVERCGEAVRHGAAGIAGIGMFADAWRQGDGALQQLMAHLRERCTKVERPA